MHDWWNETCRALDETVRGQALARQDQLTKPRGALGSARKSGGAAGGHAGQ